MTVFVTYNEGSDASRHQCYKLTLPLKWRRAPASRLLAQFVGTYNAKHQARPLDAQTHCLEARSPPVPLPRARHEGGGDGGWEGEARSLTLESRARRRPTGGGAESAARSARRRERNDS